MRTGAMVILLAGATALAQAPAAGPASKPASDARAAFDLLFKRDMERVSQTASPADDAELAAKILAASPAARQTPGLARYMLERAHELGSKAQPGHAAAARAAEQLLAMDDPPTAEALERAVEAHIVLFRSLGGRERPAMAQKVLEELLALGDLQGKLGRWDQAHKTFVRALGWGGPKPPALREEIQARIQQANQQRMLAVQAAALKAKIEKDPHDLDARVALVRLLVVGLDQPQEAARYLNADLGEQMRTYVPLAVKSPAELAPPVALELGEWYRELAASADERGKINALTRARDYYTRYLESSSSPDLANRARLALTQVSAELEKLGAEPNWVPAGAVLLLGFEASQVTQQGDRSFLRDLSGQGNHGVIRGTSLAKGQAGDAFSFDGRSDCIIIRNSPSLQTSESMTVAMWLRPSSLGERRNPLAKCYGGEGTFTLEENGTVHYFYGSSGQDTDPYVGLLLRKPLAAGRWTHLAMVRDLRERRCTWYYDGERADRYRLSLPPRASRADVTIASGYVSNFAGRMDELGIWGRALTEREIALLFESGLKGRKLTPPVRR
ncbi:MAG: hypothetical protein BWX88_02527 [Planctomycetes bacterium ADurb.Bin126]|nr:MAG: hypothetical protein BWX88_02527 [Planctomycetes bacterium ADurb.Bin126]